MNKEPANHQLNYLSRRDSMRFLGLAGLSAMFGTSTSLLAQEATPKANPVVQGSGFYKLSLGKATVYLVSDGGFPMDPAALFGDVSIDKLEIAKRSAFLDQPTVPGHVNALLVREGSNLILIDTGCGTNFGATAGHLSLNLHRAGIDPGEVTHVVLTHAHPDHVGGLIVADGKLTYPNASVVINRAEHQFWTGSPSLEKSRLPAEMQKMVIGVAQSVLAAAKPKLELAKPDDRVGSVITIVDAPGHTPGHIALQIESEGNSSLYVTDAVHVPALQLANPDWHVLYDADPVQAAATRRILLERAAKDQSLIAGAHIPFPSFGHVAAEGSGFRFVPRIWEW